MDNSEAPELFKMAGRYLIDPATSQDALGNDIWCLLEAAQQVLNATVAENEACFPALYLLQQSRGAFELYSRRVEFPEARHTTENKSSALLAGRDLAVEMLKVAKAADADRSSIEAQHRGGAEQENYALSFLRRLVKQPELMPGFAAVLSDDLASGSRTDWELFARLSLSEIVGNRGAD